MFRIEFLEEKQKQMQRSQVEAVIGMAIVLMIVYIVGNIAIMAHNLGRAQMYKLQLTEEIEHMRSETVQLERALAQAEDPAAMEQMARVKLGLVKEGEKIFCNINP